MEIKKEKNQNTGYMVALVGRANVGKSSIFNRLLGERRAVVCDEPGTTRDRVIGEVHWQGNSFWLMDTAGWWQTVDDKELRRSIESQIEGVVREVDLILWVIDGETGLTDADRRVWQRLKKWQNKIFLVVNKVDSGKKREKIQNEQIISLKKFLVSAKTGLGMGDLLEDICLLSKEKQFHKVGRDDIAVKMCIVGRPNVGKSTLTNALCGFDRMAIGEQAGTTRDVGEVLIDFRRNKFLLLDTAGLRAKGKAGRVLAERYSVMRAVRAMESSDVVVVVLDAKEGLTHQDMVILSMAKEMSKGIVLLVNKWDLFADTAENRDLFLERLRRKLGWIWWVPVVFGSAKEKKNITELLTMVEKVGENYQSWFKTEVLDDLTKQMREDNPRLKVLELKSIVQTRTNPPEFAVDLGRIKTVRGEDERLIQNCLRQALELYGVLIQIKFGKDK